MKISGAMNYLQKIYKLNIVAYPRVENNYIKDKPFQFFPHPPLFQFGKKFEPLEEEELKVNKETALLYLSHKRILSPANIKNFFQAIDKYYTNDLQIKPQKQEELIKIFNLLDEFLKENNLTVKDLISQYVSIYLSNITTKKKLFFLKEGKFFSLDFTISRLRKIRSFFLKEVRNQIEEQIQFSYAKNLPDAIKQFEMSKNKLSKRFKK